MTQGQNSMIIRVTFKTHWIRKLFDWSEEVCLTDRGCGHSHTGRLGGFDWHIEKLGKF
jgi:hypothetical protein